MALQQTYYRMAGSLPSLILMMLFLFPGNVMAQPSAFPAGLAESVFVHTDRSFYITGDQLWFKIYVNTIATGRPSTTSKLAYLELLGPSNKAVLQTKIRLRDGLGSGSITLPPYLVSGRYIVRAYTAWMKNSGPGSFFHGGINILNPDKKPGPDSASRYSDGASAMASPATRREPGQTETQAYANSNSTLQLTVSVPSQPVGIRSPVDLGISVSPAPGDSGSVSLSMSVFRIDEVEQARQPSLMQEVPASALLNNRTVVYLPEYSGQLLEVRVSNRKTGKPAPGVSCFLSLPGKIFQTQPSISDSLGICRFALRDYYGAGQLVLQTEGDPDQRWQLDLLNPFSTDEAKPSSQPLNDVFLPRLEPQLSQRLIHQQAQQALAASSQTYYAPPETDSLPFFGTGDKTYLLDDYTRFTTMEEVMREFIPEVQVRRSEGHFHFKVYNAPYRYFFDLDPLILLDGVPVREVDQIMAFDPLKIKSICIVTRSFFQNGQTYNGIVSYQTYQGNLAGFKLDASALVMDYEGLSLQRVFYSPNYDQTHSDNRSIPDFRELLYWNAELPIDSAGRANIRFYSSDLPGKYAVVLQGMDHRGIRGRSVQYFEVEKK